MSNIFNIIKRQDAFLPGWILAILGFWIFWTILIRQPGMDRTVAASQAMLFSGCLISLTSLGMGWLVCARHDRRAEVR